MYRNNVLCTGKAGAELANALSNIRGSGRNSFISGIQNDLQLARGIAEKGGLHFEDPLTAVYHYRKHGPEFPKFIRKFGDRIDVYLGPTKQWIFNDSNLKETCTLQVSHRIMYSGSPHLFHSSLLSLLPLAYMLNRSTDQLFIRKNNSPGAKLELQSALLCSSNLLFISKQSNFQFFVVHSLVERVYFQFLGRQFLYLTFANPLPGNGTAYFDSAKN